MYEIVILNSAAKQLRNFDKPIKNKIITTLEKIAENPFIGERLKRQFNRDLFLSFENSKC